VGTRQTRRSGVRHVRPVATHGTPRIETRRTPTRHLRRRPNARRHQAADGQLVTGLNVQPLLAAIPTPPAPKGQWGYRQWYVARKRGYLSMTDAARLCDAASLRIEDVYPQLEVEQIGYINGELHRDCAKCGTSFVAKRAGERGSPKTSCQPCPEPVKQCKQCGALFQRRSATHCSKFCSNMTLTQRRREKLNSSRNLRITAKCDYCDDVFDKRQGSKARYCSICRQIMQTQNSGYKSPYPMCAACGKAKPPNLASCGSIACKAVYKTAKGASATYKIPAETVMVLRSCPRCDSCKVLFDGKNTQNIDHCHTTGRIRGILCKACNTALGFAKESPDRLRSLAAYIEASS